MVIRLAARKDTLKLFGSLANCAKEFPEAYQDFNILSLADQAASLMTYMEEPGAFAIIAEKDGQICGHLIGRASPPTSHLWSLYVKPEKYGNGTAVSMWGEFEKLAQERGVESWESYSDPKTHSFLQSIAGRYGKEVKVKYLCLTGTIGEK